MEKWMKLKWDLGYHLEKLAKRKPDDFGGLSGIAIFAGISLFFIGMAIACEVSGLKGPLFAGSLFLTGFYIIYCGIRMARAVCAKL